jgi:hypothetical protein
MPIGMCLNPLVLLDSSNRCRDFVTLLFQKAGQSGLEICPGREVSTSFGYGDTWTKVEPNADKNAISTSNRKNTRRLQLISSSLQHRRPTHELVRRSLQVDISQSQSTV